MILKTNTALGGNPVLNKLDFECCFSNYEQYDYEYLLP